MWVRHRSPAGRWVLLATVLGSGLVVLDATVVNVALPAIGQDFGVSFTGLQWIVNAYTLTLAGLLLLGGALGDRYGRRRLFVVGILWFAGASLACGIAPNAPTLIVARAVQGIGAALLTPGSLAIIETTFHPEDRSAAIGAWSGLGGVMTAIGPVVGGYLTTVISWRVIFFINLPLAAVAAWAAMRHLPESREEHVAGRLDYLGAALAALGLGGVVFAVTAGPVDGWATPPVLATGVGGIIALISFVVVERSRRHPLVPLEMFRVRQFTAANAVTFVVYGALGGALFLLPIQLQRVVGLSALESGSALIPMTIAMLLLSSFAGRLAQRVGPRRPMTVGPFVAAIGLALLVRVGPGRRLLAHRLPGRGRLRAGPLDHGRSADRYGAGRRRPRARRHRGRGQQRRRAGGRSRRGRDPAAGRRHHGWRRPRPSCPRRRLSYRDVGGGLAGGRRRGAQLPHDP